MLIFATVQHQ